MQINTKMETGKAVRALARSGSLKGQTAGRAPDHLQGNVVILPLEYASEFLLFCMNNPKPCPLIGLSSPGEPSLPSLGCNIDIRSDVPGYRVYKNGALVEEVADITDLWTEDLVTFVLGCSFTFEEALLREGYDVRHISTGCNVPMFRTNIPTIPGGRFRGPMVVTMRPFPEEEIPRVFELCSHYPHAHGTPLFWGETAAIGIKDLKEPDYGDPVEVKDGEVPVFWACGVTPQAAITEAKPSMCITHAPGHMLVTDISSDESVKPIIGMHELIQTQPIEL